MQAAGPQPGQLPGGPEKGQKNQPVQPGRPARGGIVHPTGSIRAHRRRPATCATSSLGRARHPAADRSHIALLLRQSRDRFGEPAAGMDAQPQSRVAPLNSRPSPTFSFSAGALKVLSWCDVSAVRALDPRDLREGSYLDKDLRDRTLGACRAAAPPCRLPRPEPAHRC